MATATRLSNQSPAIHAPSFLAPIRACGAQRTPRSRSRNGIESAERDRIANGRGQNTAPVRQGARRLGFPSL
jgi:hypothetical protein